MALNNYMVISNCHERYSFETDVILFYDTTIEDICKKLRCDINQGELIEGDFIIDKSHHSEIDNEYTYPNIDKDLVQHIHLDTIAIVPLDHLLNGGSFSWCWGQTESKFGLLDKKPQK